MEQLKRIPEHASEITPGWFSHILGHRIVESNYKLEIITDGGFLSVLARTEFETDDRKFHHLVVKILPDEKEHGLERDLVKLDDYDKTEILAYKQLIPDLLEIWPELKNNVCKEIFAEFEQNESSSYASVLVLPDLKHTGYFIVTINEPQGLGSVYLSQALSFMAKLHAVSIELEKRKNCKISDLYQPWFPTWYNPNAYKVDPFRFSFFTDGFPVLYELLAQNPSIKQGTYETLKIIEKNTNKVFRSVLEAGQAFPSLIHGDMWCPNIMINQNSEFPIKIIDWQMIGYTDPAYEVALLAVTSLPLEYYNLAAVKKLVHEYFEKYLIALQELNIESERSFVEFEAFFNTYGLAFGFIWIVMGGPHLKCHEYAQKFHAVWNLFEEANVIQFIQALL